MLRSSLRANQSDFAPIFVPPAAKAAEIARCLVARYGEGQPRKSTAALETLLGRLRVARFAWEKVAPADRLDVVWVLWSGAVPPAEHSGFLHGFLDWLETPHHRYQAMRLAIAWAAAFDPRLPSVRIVGDWLSSHVMWLPDPWRRLTNQFQLFSVDRSPGSLAGAFLRAEPAVRYFETERLPAIAVRGGLGAEILAAAVTQIKTQAAQPDHALRLCDLALEVGAFEAAETPRLTARRSDLQISLAEALLLPWEFQAPPPEAKTSILAFLLRRYGDMRIAPKRWRALCLPAIAVMHRWLTEETVATYFRLAGRSKLVERKNLAERRRFWMSRLEQIDGAWLSRGTQAAAEFDAGNMAHGRLGGRPDQVALLFRVGNFTVLEMAHEASERIWLAGNPLAPSLYQPSDHIYWPGMLAQGVDFSSAYGDDGRLTWQARLAAFLERETAHREDNGF